MNLDSGRELNDEFFDAPANNEAADAGAPFYEGVDIETLDGDDFERFWDDLAQRNEAAFVPGTAMAAPSGSQAAPAEPQEEDPEAEARKLEADCERLRKLLHTRTVDREIYRRTLAFCVEMKEFNAAEDHIQESPEFGYSDQTPFRYISVLINEGGLEQFDLDEDGEVIDPARYEGLTEDEVDDLIFTYGLRSTEAGRIVAEEHAPARRIRELMATFPDRADIFQELLGFIKDNHCKYEQIQELFRGRDFSGLATASTEKHIALQPSVFLDNMEKAGGIVWDRGGWTLTPEGEALLERLLARSAG